MVQLIVAVYSSVLQYPLCASADGYPRYPHALLRHYPLHAGPDLYQRYICVFLLLSPLCVGFEGTLPTLYVCVLAPLPSLCGFRGSFTNVICMCFCFITLSVRVYRLLPTLYACICCSVTPPSDLYQRYMHVFVGQLPLHQTFTNVTCVCCYSVTPSVRPLPTLHTCVFTQLSHPSDLYQRYMHVL